MPPESSTLARPAISRIHSAASAGVRLSSSRCVAPQSSASSSSARVRTSISIGQAGCARARSSALAHAAGRGDVIVLDQDGVVEAHAVIGDAAGGRRHLFQRAQARRGLARIEDAAARARDGVGVTRAPASRRRSAAAGNSAPRARSRAACARVPRTVAITSPSLQRSPLALADVSSSTPPRSSIDQRQQLRRPRRSCGSRARKRAAGHAIGRDAGVAS